MTNTVGKRSGIRMKKTYSIGFLIAAFLVVFCLGAGYQYSYQYVMDRQEARIKEEQKKEESITTRGDVQKNEGYYLKELHGYVAVYFSDNKTLYELTEISVAALPDEVREELRDGKFLKTVRELYGFLENYSS